MAPPAGSKRKRGDRSYSGENFEGSRPSPHRPGNLNMAHQPHGSSNQGQRDFQESRGGRGNRRGNRGGAYRGTTQSPRQSPMNTPSQQRQSQPNTQNQSTPTSQPQFQAPEPNTSTASPAPVTVAATQTPPPDDPPEHFTYDLLTDEVVEDWQSSYPDVIAKGVQARKEQNVIDLSITFQELVRSAIAGRLSYEDASSAVKSILENDREDGPEIHESEYSPPLLFLDTITMLVPSGSAKESPMSDRQTAILSRILRLCGLSPHMITDELDLELLQQLNFVRNGADRRRVQYQTQVLYRQSNYNLLREESEGYSKLITELFTTSGNEPPSADVVTGLFERVKAMIGAFDLDVGRVLDIHLDIFAAVLVRKYRFFVKYLCASTWWPHQSMLDKYRSTEMSFRTLPTWALPQNTGFDNWSEEDKEALQELRVARDTKFWKRVREVGIQAFFELSGRQVTAEDVASESKEVRAWTEATGVVPMNGNVVAAQVLGFKLRFYSSPARSANDVLPMNLIFLAALLIKIGFITLQDLYPHLWPNDDDMAALKEQKMKEKEERERASRPGGSGKNALAMAAALTDDTLAPNFSTRQKDAAAKADTKEEKPATADEATKPKEELPEPSDQKVQLLKSLLCIGAIPEALFILGKFPWLPDAFPELPEHIHRILHHCLSKVYEPIRPLALESHIGEPHSIVDPDQSGVAKASVRRINQPPLKTLRWAQLDKFESNENTNYVFYWDEWADNVPICQDMDDVFALCNSLLAYSGVKIGQDPALLAKLVRIGKHSLATDTSESNQARWIDLSKRLLVPALSLTKRIPGVIEEVWDLIKQFSAPIRFSIYAEWYYGAISRTSDIKAAFEQSRAETKDCLKRISKTNVKPMARQLAKVATSSPGVVFSVAIGQIESYDNLVDVVVECGRYFTFLGYDVLTWSLMNSLGNSKARVTSDGMLTSLWLRALSEFSGKVFKRYNVMSPTPILQYVLFQLQKSNPTDLVVLEEIVSSMTGIVSDSDLNDAQLTAMAGGKALQSQIMLQLLDRRHEAGMKITAKRLMKALTDPKLAGPLLVAIAQERQTCIYRVPEEDAYLKLLGNLYDKIHRVLSQYLDLLRSNLSVTEFDQHVPSLAHLIGDFGLDPVIAFWISRASLTAESVEHDDKVTQEKFEQARKKSQIQENAKSTESADIEMTTDGNSETPNPTQSTDEASDTMDENSADTEMQDGQDDKDKDTTEALAVTPAAVEEESPWHPVLQRIITDTRPFLPEDTFEILSENFYFTFWQMSLGDVFMPMSSYEGEMTRCNKKKASIQTDRSDLSARGTQKKEAEIKVQQALYDDLNAEMKTQIALYQRGRERLKKEKDHWFTNCWGKWDALHVALLEHCFIPRMCFSPLDATYVFKLLKLMHGLGTRYFRTVGLLDQFFNKDRLTSLFFLCTSREADNIGRFINEVLKDLARWHADKTTYEKEAHGLKGKPLPGFCIKFDEDRNPLNLMEYEDFRRILVKWHTNLSNALKICFQGGEYMHIRNAIALLKSCSLVFPVIDWMGKAQIEQVTQIGNSDKRDDIKLAAKALLGHLKRRQSSWVSHQSFVTQTKDQSATKATTPQPESNTKLNAKAAEFKPKSPAHLNGLPKPEPLGTDKMEVEEGEVKSAGLAPDKSDPASMKMGDLSHSKHSPDSSRKDELKAGEKRDESKSRVGSPAPKSDTADTLPAKGRETSRLPSRPESSRPTSLPSAPPRPVNGRTTSHTLPNRPEVPLRNNDRRERAPDRHYGDDTHGSRYPPDHRRDAPPSADYPSQRDHGYHSGGYGSRHDRDRQELSWAGESRRLPPDPRYDGPPSTRDSRGVGRDDRSDRRDRTHPEYESSRGPEPLGRLPHDASMAPPRAPNAPHPDRAPRQQQDDRHAGHLDRRPEATRADDYPGSQRSSRGASPVRRDDRPSRSSDYQYRDERGPPDGRRAPETRNSRSQYEEGRLPSGPRGDRPPEHPSNVPSERLRDTFNSSPAASNSRYPQNDRLQGESSYGRLNADPPPGPRANGSASTRGGRAVSSTLPPVNTQTSAQSASQASATPDRQAPTGPSAGRNQTRAASAAYNRSAPSSAPPTQSAESPDTSGVHPDRLKAIQVSDTTQSPRSGNAPAAAPSGPRAPAPQHSTPDRAANERAANDRNSRGDRRFAGVNNILQQPGQPPVPERVAPAPATRSRARNPNLPPSPSTAEPPRIAGSREDHLPSRPDPYDNRPSAGSGGDNRRVDDRNTREAERRPAGRHEPRPESPRRHSGVPTHSAAPSSRPPYEDRRDNSRRVAEPTRPHDMRETRARPAGPPAQAPPERDLRRAPREDLMGGGRDLRDRDGRRDSSREEWEADRGPRDRRSDINVNRRDTGPSAESMGSFRSKRPPPNEEGGYDRNKRTRR